MICIRKPHAPAVLTAQGVTATADLNADYARTPVAYRRGKKHFEFDKSIYSHDDVKTALRKMQHDKCAFCESKITHVSYGDVEHFRPKAGVRQSESDALKYPGYYWLAYEWSNLFLACELCNQRFKGNLFPLRVQKHRARSHNHQVSKEAPLLIEPTDDPEKHLTFAGELAAPKNRSRLGKFTIEVMGLNRSELLEKRLGVLKSLIALRDAWTQLRAIPNPSVEAQRTLQKIHTLLDEAIRDDAEYAAMARATLA